MKEQVLPNNFYGFGAQDWPKTPHTKSRSLIQKTDDLGKLSTRTLDESALIVAAQRGDLDSFNGLVLAYQDCLFNTALRILGDAELAADATQEAFLSAFRSINQYRGGSFRAWLMRTVTNACYDELRRQKRRPALPFESLNADGDEMENSRWLIDSSRSPEEEFEAAELEDAIQHCLDALPAKFRTLIVLADVQGMNYNEMAHVVRVPLGTIKSRLARARLCLRERLLLGFCELLPDAFHLEQETAMTRPFSVLLSQAQ